MDRFIFVSVTLLLSSIATAQSTDPDYQQWVEESSQAIGRVFGDLNENFTLTPDTASPADAEQAEQAGSDSTTNRVPVADVPITQGDTRHDETNASPQLAMPQQGQLDGIIDKAGDRDEFVIEVSRHGQWTTDLISGPAKIDFGIFAYPNGGWLIDRSPPGDNRLQVDLTKPGKYVFRVWASEGDTGGYRFRNSFIPSVDRFEPNNHVADAEEINSTTRLTGTILPAGDRDEFLIDVPHHGEWQIRLHKASAGVTLNYGVYPHPNGGWLPDMGPPEDDQLIVDLPKPGKYVLRVWGLKGDMRSIDPYQLDLQFKPSPDPFEPNNTVANAASTPGTTSLSGTVLPRGDRDEYLFETQSHGQWRITEEATPSGVTLQYGVYPHPNGGWLPNMAGEDQSGLTVDLPRPGKYQLRVWGKDGNMRSIEPYRLNLKFTESPDTHEPNNQAAKATSITGTQRISATLLPRGDRDEYLFEAPHQGQWQIITHTSPPNVELHYGVYPHPNGGWLPNMAANDSDGLIVDLPAAGKYLLRVNATNGTMRSVEPYQLNLTFTASADQHEPNNNVAAAKTIGGTSEILGTILPRGDRDEFIFDAPTHGQWSIALLDTPADVEMQVGVYPHPNGGWLPNMGIKDDPTLIVDLPSPGRYVLRSWAAGSTMRSIEPYRLGLNFIASTDTHEPNNKVADATAISGTGKLSGTLLPRGDRDEFIFNAPRKGHWIIKPTRTPDQVELNYGVYPHPNGGWLRNTANPNDGVLAVEIPSAGKYLLRVWGKTSAMRSIEPWEMSLQFE